MALKIETFTNADSSSGWRPGNNPGGHSLFKALGHPKAMPLAQALGERLKVAGRLAIYDPEPTPAAEPFDVFFGLKACDLAGVFVQRVEDVGGMRLGQRTRPVTDLSVNAGSPVHADALFIAAFDAGRYVDQLTPMLPKGMKILTLDEMRLPDDWLGNPKRYLDPINFATNFGFLRDAGGLHTRIASANYWAGYGAKDPELWLCLFDQAGAVLGEWTESLGAPYSSIVIDSREVRQRFGLGDFAGSLFMHCLRAKGHDVVKYALDTFSSDGAQLSCTHDANAWPADFYAGVPAPKPGEKLILWVQNSHPAAIPAKAIGANAMGSQEIFWIEEPIPPFGTRPVDLGKLLPDLKWPSQIELQAGRHYVRPRYEVTNAKGRIRIAHANVERTDLTPDPRLPALGTTMGKGYLMPLPVLPMGQFRSLALPTPMSTSQHELPIKVVLYDATGVAMDERYLGRIQRRDSLPVDIDEWLSASKISLASGYGHVEFLYDFRDGGDGDGWLHALGHYEMRASGHAAETIFGAHIYNTPIVYRDEPQSYTHRPPGLTTRLHLRLGAEDPSTLGGAHGVDTLCHLIYPASLPWREHSATQLTLMNRLGKSVASREIRIACGGSYHWRYRETFTAPERRAAGNDAYVQIVDSSCRLFGFHGLVNGDVSFSLDHMFGF
jgi:hypothetical protein